ncbi:MAG: flagellar motor protein MotB [Kofleriaceae bacterium]|nr:flagellar motor protein MotB [Myxococcales bacterium]MCB9563385.1 flagellar motor protein MotB [Kofleriaceae bacterium]MCB9573677.1 flagellar motor protein MotB [Kofleriaceae bacterium]
MAIQTATDESGILVLPGGKSRGKTKARGRAPERTDLNLRRRLPRWLPWVAGAIVIMGGGAYAAHRVMSPGGAIIDPRTSAAAEVTSAQLATGVAQARIGELEAELETTRKELAVRDAEAKQAEAERAVLAKKAAEAELLQQKLTAVVGGSGEITQDGDEIRLQLVDKVLFRVGEDELTPRGKAVLAKVGEAIGDLVDKQIWVQGHTDDTPIKGTKGQPPRFASNWELSAARALTVVHYLQDEAGVDPKLLAAVAFGEHRPASRSKAKNRRIEIVLYPKHEIVK